MGIGLAPGSAWVLRATPLAALVAGVLMLSPALAFGAQEKTARQQELDRLEQEIKLSEERAAALRREIEVLRRDRAKLTQGLIETGARIKAREGEISAGEERLARLADNEGTIRGSLDRRRAVIAELLAAMQRVGANPPPALLVRPEDALSAVRAALLLGSALPELRVEAEALAADLRQLVELKDRIRAEQEAMRHELAALAEERARLAALAEERKAAEASSERDLDAARRQAETLAVSAKSLKELIGRMESEVQPARRAAGEAELATREAERRTDPKMALAALGDPGRLKPALPFATAQGLLPLPASGVKVRGFGEPDGFGSAAKGISLATRAGAQVTSPADGWVVYAGPFRSYGQLLIINAGGGYHVLLAGMETISVELGRFVLAGEPVAVMGGWPAAAPAAGNPGVGGQPVLYVEFRKDGAAIDPSPWWTSRNDEKVRG